jgi:hypothetical protein
LSLEPNSIAWVISLNGLYTKEPEEISKNTISSLAVAMVIVTLWKVSGGTWEAALASGSFFIMLLSLSPGMCK